jgi:HEAT repeat protein
MNGEIDQTLNNKMSRASAIRALIAELGSNNGEVRKAAREELVRIGRPAVAYLAGLLDNKSKIIRWESVKALGSIADPDSVPFLIGKMSDPDEQVRWLASEGLIAIGPDALAPVLEEFLCDPKSLWIQKGVHHFLIGMVSMVKMKDLNDLIAKLHRQRPELYAPGLAYRILRKVGRSKSMGNFCEEDRHHKVKVA